MNSENWAPLDGGDKKTTNYTIEKENQMKKKENDFLSCDHRHVLSELCAIIFPPPIEHYLEN